MATRQDEWFVVAIGGITCGGKSTLANSLHECLPKSKIIRQDDYFHPIDSPHHVKVKNLNHNNFDVITAMDMPKMTLDIQAILQGNDVKSVNGHSNGVNHTQNGGHTNHNLSQFQNKNILLIEGFCVLNYRPIVNLCDLKFEIFLSKEECVRRRNVRVYDPPDVPGYFEMCVWPEYLKYKKCLKSQKDVILLDGTRSDLVDVVLHSMESKFSTQNT